MKYRLTKTIYRDRDGMPVWEPGEGRTVLYKKGKVLDADQAARLGVIANGIAVPVTAPA